VDVKIKLDQHDKHLEMLDDFFDGKQHSIKAAYQDFTGDRCITGEYRDCKNLKAAVITSQFDQALGDSIARKMLMEYNSAGLESWRKIVNIAPLSDFRTQRRVRIGGYGNLAIVNQSAAYAAVTSPTDEEATYSVNKRGGIEDVTLEAIRNDDVLAVRRVPVKLARAAARTLYTFVFDLIATNPTIYDSVTLFNATHSNIGTSALAQAPLLAGRMAMMKQTDSGSSEVLGITPRYLVVPPDLEATAWGLVVSPSTGYFIPTAAQGQNIQTWETIVVKTWTDTNNWFLVADPSDIPSIEIGFLDGKTEPELFIQDAPNAGTMFTNDKITYKIRHVYGGAVTDYRGLYGAIVP